MGYVKIVLNFLDNIQYNATELDPQHILVNIPTTFVKDGVEFISNLKTHKIVPQSSHTVSHFMIMT